MSKQYITYMISWALYGGLAFLLFPDIKVVALLLSIPLTVIGGWLYLIKGAVGTTLLTIPFHYLLISYHSDDPAMLKEAFNPFGIGLQLLFSIATAYIKITQNQYERLNNSMTELIEERTRDIEQVTAHLIGLRKIEETEFNNYLLKEPFQGLQSIKETFSTIQQRLKTDKHARMSDADTIAGIIDTCINQLDQTDDSAISSSSFEKTTFTDLIDNLINRVNSLTSCRAVCTSRCEWDAFDTTVAENLFEIISEAVTNALRHAQAKHIEIGLLKTDTATTVFIENDGKPLSPDIEEGMGLPLMRYRASKIGAKLSISRCENSNTRMECVLPTG